MAQLYKITCNVTNLCYWGIVYKEGKTYLDRFEEHVKGKGGVHIYKAIQEYGRDAFDVELIEEGSKEYVSEREDQESKKTLYVRGEGYNGNVGNAIFNTKEAIDKIISKRDEVKRVETWHATMEKNKKDQEWVEKRKNRKSKAIKEKWKNPTRAMLDGKKREAQTKLGKKLPKSSIAKKGKMMGEENSNFKFWWCTPKGKFATLREASLACGYQCRQGITIARLCNAPNKKISRQTCNTLNMPHLYGKTHLECGFYREYVK